MKLYCLAPMRHTVFDDPAALRYLAQRNIVLTSTQREATLYVTRRFPFPGRRNRLTLLCRINLARRPILIWTHEPRFCLLSTPTVREGWLYPPLYVQNVYTGNLYLNNYCLYGGSIDRPLDPVSTTEVAGWARENRIVALATFRDVEYPTRCVVNGRNIDLLERRQKLIQLGHALGMVDIYGRGWPGGLARGESRGGGWEAAKREILQRYRFNICLENTAFDYYCTEKIWDSIAARCLPIYSSFNNRIYEDFPRGSFLDCDEFPDDEALLRHIATMTADEYCERLNRCIEVFNRIYYRNDYRDWRQRVLERTADLIVEIGGRG